MPGHTKCCTCHAKSSQQTWRSDAPKCNPSQENQRPDLLTALMNMSLVLRLPRKMHLCRPSSNVPRLPSLFEILQNPHVLLTSDKVHNPLRLPRETTSERPKVVRTLVFLTFWLGNVLRATTACTFSTSQLPKVVRALVRFVHFDFEVCFAPQGRALFRHLNFQKWSGPGAFCAFWLRNVLRATRACTFSTSQLPKVVRAWCVLNFDFEVCFAPQRRALFRHLNFQKWSEPGVLCVLAWKCASCHNGVHFFDISNVHSAPAALASLLFDLLEPQIIGKTECFATCLPFRAPASSFFWLFLFSDLLSFCSSLLYSSAPPLLLICPYCRKFDF